MLFVIVAQDMPGSIEKRLAARPQHLARVQCLRTEGRLVLAGPFPCIESREPGPAGFSGSLIVAEFPDLTAARDWANADPYVLGGVWAEPDVRPFIQVLP